MKRLGTKQLRIELQSPIDSLPDSLSDVDVQREEGGMSLLYNYDVKAERTGITSLLSTLSSEGIVLRDLQTYQSSLEDIFVNLVADIPE